MDTGAVARHKRTYIPYMADHAYVVAAAMRHHGIPAEVLPPPERASLDVGLQLCGGRECFPCFTCLGDVIRKAREPGFDPAASAIYLPTSPGPCRFGQYGPLLRDLLEQQGIFGLEILGPSAANSYQGFGENPGELRKLAAKGLTAADLLTRLLHEFRPYELQPGSTDAACRECLGWIVEATEAGDGGRLLAVMHRIAVRFAALPVDRTVARPLVGIVGEIYVRWNAFTNRDLFRQVEGLGGEVLVSTLTEMLYFTNFRMKAVARVSGEWRDVLRASVVDAWQHHWERKLHRPVAHLLRRPDEAPVPELAKAIGPYYDAALGTEAVLSMGRAIEYAHGGADGIINVLPFSCMPGVIVTGMAPRLRRDLDNIPWLDIPYDAQKETNIRTRLEAFMHQVVGFHRRRDPPGVRRPSRRRAHTPERRTAGRLRGRQASGPSVRPSPDSGGAL
jgi:predicted nucleotide-binding protein (sugar kinase/HSP70/actin superfamily)